MLRSSRDLHTRYTTGLIDGSASPHVPGGRTPGGRGSDESSRESGAALGAAVLDHGATSARAHPGAKAVLLCTAMGVGLKCTLHVVLLEDPAGCSAGSTRSDTTRRRTGRRSRPDKATGHRSSAATRVSGATGAVMSGDGGTGRENSSGRTDHSGPKCATNGGFGRSCDRARLRRPRRSDRLSTPVDNGVDVGTGRIRRFPG